MGIYDRDYMRRSDGSRRQVPWRMVVPCVITALALLVAASRCTHEAEPETLAKGSLRVNVNTATHAELETIPGIGPSRAKAIVDHRPYVSVDDLRERKALGGKLTEAVRPFVKTDGPNEKIRLPAK
jgi:competence ComEA-like helix-hairpin-helix protein